MSIVELDRISKAYDTKIAVHELSLAIEAGQMFGLLGPNGASKTSSIRMMIGITMPDSGTVTLFGQPFARKDLTRIGYLPEVRGLYCKMKVMDQLVFMGQMHGLGAALPETVRSFYYRGDSASHEKELLTWLRDENRADGPRGRSVSPSARA